MAGSDWPFERIGDRPQDRTAESMLMVHMSAGSPNQNGGSATSCPECSMGTSRVHARQ